MNQEQTNFDWQFAGQWFLTSVAGLLAGGMLGFTLFWTIGEAAQGPFGEAAAIAFAGAVLGGTISVGASMGPAQLLRRRGVRARSWMSASTLAGALGMAMAMTIILSLFDPETLPRLVTAALFGATLGLSLGMGQWLALQRNGVSAGAWPVISAVAFTAAMIVGLPLGGENREWLSLGVVGLIAGGVTALGMTWLLRQRAGAAVWS